ncbi:MAG: dockerin type I repeat-containing protein, partial [Bacteroidota bacterium]
IDSLYTATWMDGDLGCFTNDYTGSIPELNTFYFYNGEAVDNDCGVDGYGDNPPVFSSTLLNAPLTNYHSYNSDFTIIGNPEVASDFYNYMNGFYKDGITPVEYGGNGFQQGTFPYPWFYPTNPNDLTPGGWSEVLEMNDPADRRGIGGTGPYNFPQDAVLDFDQAFCFFQDSSLNHIETVDLLYQQLPLLQAAYDNDFTDNQPIPNCTSNCIWPGDLNRDGIVDVIDFLRLKEVDGLIGPARSLNSELWYPYPDPDWPSNQTYSDGISFANADCNGDGIINAQDELNTILLNYQSTNNAFVGPSGGDVPGQQLYVEKTIFSPPLDAVTVGALNQFDIRLALPPEEQGNVAGIAFEIFVQADTENGFILPTNPLLTFVGAPSLNISNGIPRGQVLLDFASVSTEGQTIPNVPDFLLARFRMSIGTDPIDCNVKIIVRNVLAVRTDGTYFTIENEDSVWPVVGCEIVNTEDPKLPEVSVDLIPNPSSDQVTLFTE